MPKLVAHQPTRERVARNLKRLLKEKKLALKALAADSDVERSVIYRIKNAESGAVIDVLGRLAAGFKVDVSEFFRT